MEVILIQEYKEMHKLRNNYSWIHSESYWLGYSFGTSDSLGVRPVIEFTLE